jgi:four helix bundle protein
MATVNSFEELEVWKRARELSADIYWKTKNGPFESDFSLKDQINRASGSVSDNIAEGFERNGNGEFGYFLTIAKGSVGEVRSQLYRALDRKYIAEVEFEALREKAISLSKMISALRSSLRESGMKGSRFRKRDLEE